MNCNLRHHMGLRHPVSAVNIHIIIIIGDAVRHCNALQYTATRCNALQHTATHCNTLPRNRLQERISASPPLNHPWTPATHYKYTTARRNALQHTAIHCNAIVCRSGYQPLKPWTTYGSLHHTATHYYTLQHTATYCNMLPHTHINTIVYRSGYQPLKPWATRGSLQHTETRCNTLQHNHLQKRISASQAMDHPWIKFQGESFKSSTPPSLPHTHSHVHTQIHACYCGMCVCVFALWCAEYVC